MGAVWFRFRSELRARWRAWVLLGLLLGVTGGAVLAAVAGARRTDTTYGRFLAATGASDFGVEYFGDDPQADYDALERRPEVAAAGRYTALGLVESTPDGGIAFPDFFVLASDGRRFYAVDRPKILAGRMPRADRAREVLANRTLAEARGVEVGDTIDLLTAAPEVLAPYLAAPDGFEQFNDAVRRGEVEPDRVRFTITGIGLFPSEVAQDEQTRESRLIVTPRFVSSARPPAIWTVTGLRLRPGVDRDAFRAVIDRVVSGGSVTVTDQANTTRQVERSVAPHISVLALFAALVGGVGMLVIGQALSRQAIVDGGDASVLRALGLSARNLATLASARGVVIGLTGATFAVVVAVLVSSFTPLGPVRAAEPEPGLAVDVVVVSVGALAIVLFAVAWTTATSLVAEHRRRALPAVTVARRSSRLVERLAGMGASPSSVAGVRAAIQSGQGAEAIPVRTTLMGASVSVATLVAVLAFAVSLDRLTTTPRRYGWSWDISITGNGGYNSLGPDEETGERPLERRLAEDPGVRAWAWAWFASLRIDGRSAAAVGIEPGRGSVFPTLLEGRQPTSDDEVVLGTTTLRRLDKDIGETVRLAAGAGVATKRIVGRAVFPALGLSDTSGTALGDGVALTSRALDDLVPDVFPNAALVDLTDGPERSSTLAALRKDFPDDPLELSVFPPQQPGAIVEYERVRWTPITLAGLLAALGAGTLVHALMTVSRRRRRDLAILGALGLTRRQVGAIVRWQASTIAVVALAVGIPVGLVLGRLAWQEFADGLGVAGDSAPPIVAIVILIPAALLVANLLAALPARSAARMRAATVLRSE